jgi:hypothetical protein
MFRAAYRLGPLGVVSESIGALTIEQELNAEWFWRRIRLNNRRTLTTRHIEVTNASFHKFLENHADTLEAITCKEASMGKLCNSHVSDTE